MNAPPKEELRRGWCPSTLRPMETGDGWLVRLHPPGARLTPAQLRRIAALATEHGNGLVEISARANLQIRGVTAESHPKLVERLLAERLVDEPDGDGPQRLTLVSPLAGRDPTSLLDAAALAAEIELRARTLSGLPAKLCVVIDDGGAQALDGFASDIRLLCIGAGRLALRIGESPWLGPVAQAEAVTVMEAILRGFARLRSAAPDHIRRMRDLSPVALAGLTGLPETTAPAARPKPRRVGLFAAALDRFAALIGLPFGRCPAATLERLVAGLETDAAEIRLSPWRGLAFRGFDRARAEAFLMLAGDLGLITRDDDPRLSVQACAGSPACSRAEASTMADAAVLAEATAGLLAGGVTLHVSGCVKACAHPAAADLTLVGREGRYDVVPGGTTRDKPVATLDLSALLTRLQPGEDIHARLKAVRSTGSQG
ncbi:precorrin-3B synthase [uncultured Bosea sp.]|uniref:precorrin-3B synthase n=1 Tax=uncultured Bosea sp. TaxID=211457 RepID=UPI0025CCAA1F|nr:precorrin-3B synthase [uncultured Bosea sp.]